MRKGLLTLLLMVPMLAHAGVNCYTNLSYNGTLVTNPITSLCAKTFPDNGSDYNHVLFTWNTPIASDSHVWIAIPGVDFSEADVSRKACDGAVDCSTSALVTSHSVLVTGFNPNKTYAFYVSSCTTGPNCARTDGHMSSGPFGTNVANLRTFTTPDSNPAHAFDWQAWFTGPHGHLMRTHQYLLSINGIKLDGPDPTTTYITAITVDGQSCFPLSLGGNTCGTTHFTIQPTCGYDMTVNGTTHNYRTSIAGSGAHSGQAFCSSAATDYELVQLRLLPDNSATIGAHTISMSLIQTNASGVQIGSTQTPTYSVTVEAAPTFSQLNPTTFPAIPNLAAWQANMFGTDVTTGHAVVGAVQNYTNFKIANTTPPGIYNNDAASSTIYTINPWGFMTYRGADQVPLQIMDYIAGVTTAFTGTHAYNYGDMICTNGAGGCLTGTNYVLVETDAAGCTSGGSLGAVPAPGSYLTTGTCHFGNIGNRDFWLEMTERAATQQRDYLLNLGQYTIAQEWASFDNFMWCQRANANCSTSRDGTALLYMIAPFCPPAGCPGLTPQRVIYDGAREPFGFRSLPYGAEHFVNYWLMTGTKPIDNSVDEIQIRKDMMIQVINHLIEYSTTDGVESTYACCMAWPSFDAALGAESLISICAAEKLETGSCDPAIPVTIGRLIDWMYSNEFNLLGTNFSQPYNTWAEPFTSGIYNYKQPSLNNLMAPAFAWYWAMSGDACTLPTSGTSCLTAADTYFRHTMDTPTGGAITGKEDSEWYKWFMDYYKWRTGAWDAFQMSILPAYNPLETFPQKMEPMPQGSFPTKPTATALSTTATITWYEYERPTTISIKYGLTPSTITTPLACDVTTITQTNVTTGQWNAVCHVSGLTPSTTYYYGVVNTDSNGNTGFTYYDIAVTGHPPFSFTTTGTPITINGTLPNGQVGTLYSATLTASGGVAPYTFSTVGCFGTACTGHDISGLSMSSGGTYSGIPNKAGSASLSVRACDSNIPSTCGTKPFSIVIAPLSGLSNPKMSGVQMNGVLIQ